MFALCGIDHITLSAHGFALLQSTQLDDRFKGIRDRSLKHLRNATRFDEADPFFNPDLQAALQSLKVEALQTDALAHFGAAEVALRAIMKQHLAEL